MAKKIGPYVGVTGFMTLGELVACDNTFREAAHAQGEHVAKNLKFMAGILMSAKTLAGEANSWLHRYPPIDRIPELLSLNSEHLLRTIHYNTKDASTIDEQVDQLMSIAPGEIDAIQLNIRWVNPVKMQRVRRKYPDLRIILQIGAGALEDVAEPGEIFMGEALGAYRDVVDDFLVDPSGGNSLELNIWHAFACIADSEIPSGMQPGVAGGREASNVHELKGLMRRLGPINIDAEGRLRTPKGIGESSDQLSVPATTKYIKAGVALVGDAMKHW
ncbi:MAG: hypothetical protein WAV50_02820 [Minisyncoccia bacterium]